MRWSPDGKQLAFVSNRSGNTEIWLQAFPGGLQKKLAVGECKYVRPRGTLQLRVVLSGEAGTTARVSITDDAGRFLAPKDARNNADTGYDRAERSFEAHYFHTAGSDEMEVPAGKIDMDVMKGFEYRVERRTLEVRAGERQNLQVELKPLEIAKSTGEQWVSSDLHIHMNYGGVYRNTPEHLIAQAEAENLGIASNLIVNKEQRIPDIAYAGRQLDAASNDRALLVHGQEFHTTQWGHLDLLNIRENILLPGYAGYPGTAAASLGLMNADVSDLAHARGAVVGYAHPFDEDPANVSRRRKIHRKNLPRTWLWAKWIFWKWWASTTIARQRRCGTGC